MDHCSRLDRPAYTDVCFNLPAVPVHKDHPDLNFSSSHGRSELGISPLNSLTHVPNLSSWKFVASASPFFIRLKSKNQKLRLS